MRFSPHVKVFKSIEGKISPAFLDPDAFQSSNLQPHKATFNMKYSMMTPPTENQKYFKEVLVKEGETSA